MGTNFYAFQRKKGLTAAQKQQGPFRAARRRRYEDPGQMHLFKISKRKDPAPPAIERMDFFHEPTSYEIIDEKKRKTKQDMAYLFRPESLHLVAEFVTREVKKADSFGIQFFTSAYLDCIKEAARQDELKLAVNSVLIGKTIFTEDTGFTEQKTAEAIFEGIKHRIDYSDDSGGYRSSMKKYGRRLAEVCLDLKSRDLVVMRDHIVELSKKTYRPEAFEELSRALEKLERDGGKAPKSRIPPASS